MLTIGQKLYSVRIKKGLTQAKLVEGTGISQSALSNIEQGKHDITVSTLLTLCGALGMGPAELFSPASAVVMKEPLTRSRLERIARIVWNPSLAKSENERLTAELLRRVLPLNARRQSQKNTNIAWNSLRRIYSEAEIKTLAERVRGEKWRRDAKRSH